MNILLNTFLKIVAVLSFGGLLTIISLGIGNQNLELEVCSICSISSLLLIRYKKNMQY